MLVKPADDKSKRIRLLEDLQKSPNLDRAQKNWLVEQLVALRRGIQGERDAGFYLDSHFKDSPNHAVIHDLRLVVDGDVAQIDHMYISRSGNFVLFETKNFSGNLKINDHGEFTVVYDDAQYGIPSPIEQSRRHERILRKVLDRLDIGGRLSKAPEMTHVVLMHPRAIIERPNQKKFDTSFLLKADQIAEWHKKFQDEMDASSVLKSMFNLRSQETIKEWAEKLTRQHRPADQLGLPDFMQPKQPVAAPLERYSIPQTPQASAPIIDAPSAADMSLAKKLICVHCKEKITFEVGKFCWRNERRFGGLQYCLEHQSLFK